jgi:hypothetical protein
MLGFFLAAQVCQGFARHDGCQSLVQVRAVFQNQVSEVTEAIQTTRHSAQINQKLTITDK